MKFSTSITLGLGCLALALFSSCENDVKFDLPQENQSFGGVVTYNNKVDVLFVVDNSTSMTVNQQELSKNVPDLINRLNTLGMDYHVAVTSTTMATDISRFPMSRQILGSPKVLTRSNINLLASRLLVGDTGSDLERGLESMEYVLSSNYLSANAPDFLRRDALLAVIFIGDEDDYSTKNTSDYINFLNALKPPFKEGGRAWIANFIGVVAASRSCDALGSHVSAGLRYLALVDNSGGVKESICNRELVTAVSNIKARLIDILSEFKLQTEPDLSTLKVYINSKLIPEDAVNGYTYAVQTDTTGRTGYYLKFHGTSIPGGNDKIFADFKPKSSK